MKNDDVDALAGQESTGELNVGGDGAALFQETCVFGGLVCCLPQSEPTVAGSSPGFLPVTVKCYCEEASVYGPG